MRNKFLQKSLRDWRPREDREWQENKWLPYEDDDVPTQKDYEFIFAHDFYKYPEKWEEYETGEKTTNWDGEEVDEKKWRIKDPEDREKHQRITDLIDAYENWENFRHTRIPPWEYKARVNELWYNGIGKLWLLPQQTGELHSLRVWFPDDFKHLIKQDAINKKELEAASFHISLAYNDRLQGELGTQLQKFYEDYFDLRDPDDPTRGYHWKEYDFNTQGGNTVSGGSTYEFVDFNDPFVNEMHEIQLKGTRDGRTKAHISLD